VFYVGHNANFLKCVEESQSLKDYSKKKKMKNVNREFTKTKQNIRWTVLQSILYNLMNINCTRECMSERDTI
jgi:predicted DNA binding CopG/RHH family protein